MFIAYIEQVTGSKLKMDNPTAAAVETPKVASSSTSKPESLAEQSSSVLQLAKHGYTEGAFVVSKEAEEVKVYELVALSEINAVLLERGLVLSRKPDSLTLSLHELAETWKPFKGKVTCPVKDWTPKSAYPFTSEEFSWEATKGKVMSAMIKAHQTRTAGIEHLSLMQNPNLVLCKTEAKKDELCLVASSTSVSRKYASTSISLGQLQLPGSPHSFKVYLPKDSVQFKKEELTWVSPFWMVQQEAESPNLVMQFQQVVIDDVKIPIPMLVNKKKIPPMTLLTVDRGANALPAAAGSPSKKQRQV